MIARSARLLLCLILPLLAAGGQAFAHQRSTDGPHTGLAIPEISHGEMIVMAEHRAAIIDLASRATDTDEPFRRVLNYAAIQYAYCFWGKMPGGVTDEASPFNECSHAYLAATKAVLLKLRDMPRETRAADAIVSEIDVAMTMRGLSLNTCAFSGEAFNTADVIRPHWADIPTHLASMASLTGLAALCFLMVIACRRLLGAKAPDQI
jgi:hypothetical protein